MDPVTALRRSVAVLPDGRTLVAGREIRIKGVPGRYRFCYLWLPDGSVTVWGPIDNAHAAMRSVRAGRVRTIHRAVKERKVST